MKEKTKQRVRWVGKVIIYMVVIALIICPFILVNYHGEVFLEERELDSKVFVFEGKTYEGREIGNYYGDNEEFYELSRLTREYYQAIDEYKNYVSPIYVQLIIGFIEMTISFPLIFLLFAETLASLVAHPYSHGVEYCIVFYEIMAREPFYLVGFLLSLLLWVFIGYKLKKV